MPRMDGFALLKKPPARNTRLPAIMLTSGATPREQGAGQCRRCVSTVLEKPLLDKRTDGQYPGDPRCERLIKQLSGT